MFEEFQLDGRAMAALERLNLGTGFALFCQEDFSTFFENLAYYGTRLSRLKVDTRIVARSLEIYQALCEPYPCSLLTPGELMETTAALEMFGSADLHRRLRRVFRRAAQTSPPPCSPSSTPNSMLQGVSALLDQILRITRDTFRATVGVLLLRDDRQRAAHPRQRRPRGAPARRHQHSHRPRLLPAASRRPANPPSSPTSAPPTACSIPRSAPAPRPSGACR